jgi:2-iminobutanoate/2-iminopropanoate deaminase
MASVRQKVNYYRQREGAATGQISRGVIPPGAAAARKHHGSLVFSSMMSGHDESPERLPPTAEKEAEVLFQHIRDFMDVAGGTPENIVNITLYVMDDSYRATAHDQVARMFPDPSKRPAYHVVNVSPSGLRNERVQAIITASVG